MITSTRCRRVLQAVMTLALAVGTSACCSSMRTPSPTADPVAHVPAGSQRLEFDLESSWVDGQPAEEVLVQTVCMMQGGDLPRCREGVPPDVCNQISDNVIRGAIVPLFEALPELVLPNQFQAKRAVRDLGLETPVTTAVTDARRSKPCNVWGRQMPGCLALLVPVTDQLGLWVVLHPAADASGAVERIDIFPDRQVCGTEPGGS